ncbi:MAG: hypothetical protein J0L58_00970 [Burkholderiales bacterium]|uniref:hypothetical protein n=1 Tax=Inhella sp. TaxID=1921806 RepID=UPI001AC53CFC|nr:hypothetical protein [Burkholderiales bacterium]
MDFNELAVLRWLHIICMVYWLGGEWGVFQTSYNVINRKLPLDERRRHMETAYRIDILARTGIILLLPLGLHMGHLWNLQPLGGAWLTGMWVLTALWLGLCWGAFIKRETDTGVRLTKVDESVRFVLIPLLFLVSIASLMGHGPLVADPGTRWYAAKMLVYAWTLIIGLKLRFIMREWTAMFRLLAQGPNADVEAKLDKSIRFGRNIAYVYWVSIATVAYFGAVKPF